MPPPGAFLESEEAARRLGIKRGTLYAYVSRGLLRSHPAPGPGRRRSLFAAEEVEALARRAASDEQRRSWTAPVTTSVTQLVAGGPRFRGRPVTDLVAAGVSYEETAELLWDGEPAPVPWVPRELGPLPALGPEDLLRWVTIMCGAADGGRADLRPPAVRASARRLIATMARSLAGEAVPGGIAASVGRALTGVPPSADVARAVESAMVVLADHELATSTMVVRLAASARAGLYDAVLAGLGAMAGPLHGGATPLAHAFLEDAGERGAEAALDHVLRWQGQVPGFGHALATYGGGDPRVRVLLPLVEALAPAERWAVVRDVIELGVEQALPPPNVDLALAALTCALGADRSAGGLLFTVARVAGWTAHYLEELGERPLRYRTQAVYASV